MKEYRIVSTIGYYYPDGSKTVYENTTPLGRNHSRLDTIFETYDEARKYLKKWRKCYPHDLNRGWDVHGARKYQWGLHIQSREVSPWEEVS